MTDRFDVLGIGNAIVDILSPVDDAFLDRHNMRKSAMQLIAQEEAERIYQDLQNPRQIAGGAVANSTVGVAALGGKAAYIGKVRADTLGHVFKNDLAALGVQFQTPMTTSGPSTARSMIVVTPDGQRTMNTYLGACGQITAADMDAAQLRHSKITFIEGYLWDLPALPPLLRQAAGLAHTHGNQVAFTLSDAWLIDRHRATMHEFIREHVDILFANEAELCSLYQNEFTQALQLVARDCAIAAVTRSADGSVIVSGTERIAITAAPTTVVDTTGAGDLYAGGFLFGLARGYPLERCGKIASLCAAEIISHLGARPQADLMAYVQRQVALV
jgi:sugar/nucleoside kinase (ribokinase family)